MCVCVCGTAGEVNGNDCRLLAGDISLCVQQTLDFPSTLIFFFFFCFSRPNQEKTQNKRGWMDVDDDDDDVGGFLKGSLRHSQC